MSLSYFAVSIVSQQTGPNGQLAISVDLKNPSSSLIALPFDPTQPSQLWFPVVRAISADGMSGPGVAFINVLTGKAMSSTGQDNQPVGLVSVGQIGTGEVWFLGGGGDYNVTRLMSDDNENLLITGPAPYTGNKIVTGGWSGGKPFEQWSYIQTNAPYPSAFDTIPYSRLLVYLNSQTGYNLASNGNAGDTSQLTVQTQNPTDPSQQFMLPCTFDPGSGSLNGCAVINQASGNAANASGDGNGSVVNQISYPPLNGASTWIPAMMPFFGNFWPLLTVQDTGQGMNIPGDGPYSPGQGVITWDDLDSNSLWQMGLSSPGYRNNIVETPTKKELQSPWKK